MPIKPTTAINAIADYIQEEMIKYENRIIELLAYVGESCLREARLKGSYGDRTGNLRSSIGYVLIRNGQVVNHTIYESDKGTDRATGVAEGRKFMDDLVQRYSNGIVLILVAGMNYAVYVSNGHTIRKKDGTTVNVRAYDVLDSAELLADRLIPEVLGILGIKIV